jgi:Fe-S-cluster-containing dehydrogenase component/anaerobic selenocysteine-containing dehydrogenase
MTENQNETMSRTASDTIPDDAALAAVGLDRRDFLRVSGTLAAAAAITASGCAPPAETSRPFHQRPENLTRHGKQKHYATVLDGAPVLVRCREGRPIGIIPNPDDPSGRGLTVRTHAALLDLYDPDRATGPRFVQRGKGAEIESGWTTIGKEVVERLREKKGDVVLLTGPVTGPATRALIAELGASLKLRHVVYQPIADDAAVRAWRAAGGADAPPRPLLERADLIVGFGAEFIDQPANGLERDFAKRRAPDAEGGMSRFIQLEGRFTLTGANADRRVRVRDSQLANVAVALAHEIIVKRKVGPLAALAEIATALAPFSGAAGIDGALITSLADQLTAAAGKAAVIAGGSASYGANGHALEAAVMLLNHSLGGPLELGRGTDEAGGFETLSALTEEVKAGKVKALIIAGPNPVYDAPIDFAEAMASVELIVSLNDRVDETAALADYLAPASHSLESWSDARIGPHLVALQQPVIRPLYDTHGLWDVLVAWGAAAGSGGAIDEAQALTRPAEEGGEPPEQRSGAYHYIRAHWLAAKVVDSQAEFDGSLEVGHRSAGLDEKELAVPTNSGLTDLLTSIGQPTPAASGLELQLYPHFAVHDGRAANNGWLQELADPITRLTWGGVASIAPRRFDDMGLTNGDLVALTVAGQTIELPAYRHAGMHEDQIAAPLGLGRTGCGEIGFEVGVNTFGLQAVNGDRLQRSGLPVELKKAGGHQELAPMQGADVIDRKPRPIVPLTTLSEYEKNPKAGTEQTPGGPSAWDDHPYEGQRWGMSIDLSKCNGCGKCTLGCQAENNIPVVGRQAIIDGREMCWMRIDRYYDAPPKEGGWGDDVFDGPLEVVEEPITVFEPMLCQHCENAPCETVCPFNATMHSEDGLNQQIYNRCVGTRYCANNCPFKVRRYNWFEYSKPQTNSFFSLIFPVLERHAALNTRGRMQMKNNPEVTVRSRGVMEKCSFCVQRIREARAEAIRNGTPGELAEGAVVPACMEACPTGAITFGDRNNPETQVAKLAESPRAMRLLEAIGVKPVISYLTKVRNDKV